MLENIIVIGVGNEYRGDDALGLLTVKKLKEKFDDKTIFFEHVGEGTSLIELWQDKNIVFLIDAICANEPVGTIHKFNLIEEKLPIEWFSSSHAFNIVEAVELARVLGQLPKQLFLYGITGKIFDLGGAISPAIYPAIETLVSQIFDELNKVKTYA